jgi:hypothetical protein
VEKRAKRLTVCVASLISLLALPVLAEDRFSAVVVESAADTGRSATAPVLIHVEEWSTDQQVQNLAGILKQKGPDGLREALWNLEAGWIRVGGGLGYPIAVARSKKTDKGRHIVLMTDRPIQFFEVWNSARSLDYPFTYIELDLGPDGKGEGKFIPAAKVRISGSTLDVESFGIQPARLLNVQAK